MRDGDGFGEFLVGVPRRFEKEVEEDGVAIAVVVAGPAEVEGQGSEERDEGDKGDGEVPRAVLDECGPGKDNPAGGKERGEEVAVAYMALIDSSRHPIAPGAEVSEVRWFAHDDLPSMAPGQEAVVAYGLQRLRAKTAYAPVAVNLLPDLFTLGEMQAVYEVLLGRGLDARNFRRDVLRAGVVEESGEVRAEGRGRPARLYRSAGGFFAVDARERRVARAISSGDDPPA